MPPLWPCCGDPKKEAYSPQCVEGVFCELRVDVALRSSEHRGGRVPYDPALLGCARECSDWRSLQVVAPHRLAVGRHQIVACGLDGVCATAAVDPVEGVSCLPGYAVEKVITWPASEQVAPRAAFYQVVAVIAVDGIVAVATVEALRRRSYLEAWVVAAVAAPDQVSSPTAAYPVLCALTVECVAATVAFDPVGVGGAHDRLRVVGAYEVGCESRPRRECHQQHHHRQHRHHPSHLFSPSRPALATWRRRGACH